MMDDKRLAWVVTGVFLGVLALWGYFRYAELQTVRYQIIGECAEHTPAVMDTKTARVNCLKLGPKENEQ